MAGNKTVVLWSDHGVHIGEKENWETFALWEQTTRVPLFSHAPRVSRDGKRTGTPAASTSKGDPLCRYPSFPSVISR